MNCFSIGSADDRRDQPTFERDRHRDIGVDKIMQLFAVQLDIDLGDLPQR